MQLSQLLEVLVVAYQLLIALFDVLEYSLPPCTVHLAVIRGISRIIDRGAVRATKAEPLHPGLAHLVRSSFFMVVRAWPGGSFLPGQDGLGLALEHGCPGEGGPLPNFVELSRDSVVCDIVGLRSGPPPAELRLLCLRSFIHGLPQPESAVLTRVPIRLLALVEPPLLRALIRLDKRGLRDLGGLEVLVRCRVIFGAGIGPWCPFPLREGDSPSLVEGPLYIVGKARPQVAHRAGLTPDVPVQLVPKRELGALGQVGQVVGVRDRPISVPGLPEPPRPHTQLSLLLLRHLDRLGALSVLDGEGGGLVLLLDLEDIGVLIFGEGPLRGLGFRYFIVGVVEYIIRRQSSGILHLVSTRVAYNGPGRGGYSYVLHWIGRAHV